MKMKEIRNSTFSVLSALIKQSDNSNGIASRINLSQAMVYRIIKEFYFLGYITMWTGKKNGYKINNYYKMIIIEYINKYILEIEKKELNAKETLRYFTKGE